MDYLEGRKIVDAIIDEKKEVKVDGMIGALLDYLSYKKDVNAKKCKQREERYEKLSKIKAPDIILQNECRMMGEHKGMADAYDDAIKVAKCIESFPEDMCQFQIMHTIDDSKRRGCRKN